MCGITVSKLLIPSVKRSSEGREGKEKELKRWKASLVLWMLEWREITSEVRTRSKCLEINFVWQLQALGLWIWRRK